MAGETPVLRKDLTFDEEQAFYAVATSLGHRYAWIRAAVMAPFATVGLAAGIYVVWTVDMTTGRYLMAGAVGTFGVICAIGWWLGTRLAGLGVQRSLPRHLETACARLEPASRERVAAVVESVRSRLASGEEISDEELVDELSSWPAAWRG